MGEGEGRAGRPRPRPPRPLSRDEERAAPRPRDVERSRDDKARSSRARGGTTGGVRLLGAQGPLSVSRGLGQLLSQGFSRTAPSLNIQVHLPHQFLDIHTLTHDPHRHLLPGSALLGVPQNFPPKKVCHLPTYPLTGHFFRGLPAPWKPQFSTTHSSKSQQTSPRSPPAGPRQLDVRPCPFPQSQCPGPTT